MGLDIVVYQKGGSKFFCEIPESIHREMFGNGANSFPLTSMLHDYYRANVYLSGSEFSAWVDELDSIACKLSPCMKEALDDLVKKLKTCRNVEKVHVAGD
ncbi:hypothetical protein [Chromobacterium sp. ATCC 53434]|uniref:hypothetical protein n=1 Tax=Chromobacterium sp. (strain ATCC 53434 / SC 14030) TaxID=2059672 RepID=UPI0013052CBE|nr:hypothetical protein [Chromobacterium sp. ATCC 53434]